VHIPRGPMEEDCKAQPIDDPNWMGEGMGGRAWGPCLLECLVKYTHTQARARVRLLPHAFTGSL